MAAYMVRGRTGILLKTYSRSLSCKALVSRHQISKQGLLVLYNASPVQRTLALSDRQIRLASTTANRSESEKPVLTITAKSVEPITQLDEDIGKERFIPISRKSLLRHLMQEKSFMTAEELKLYEKFALSLDAAIINRYSHVLQDLKAMFDPINPDKETIITRRWKKKEQLDNEFWLLQKLSAVLEKANFNELSKAFIDQACEEHEARAGVKVSVNQNRYDVMRFWALGREQDAIQLSLWEKIYNYVTRKPNPKPMEYFKRVVLAVRLKRDDKLILKAFKEVPVNSIEQLLPDGKVKMSKFDYNILYSSIFIASAGVVAKIVTVLAEAHVQWTVIVAGVTGFTAIQAWTKYKNKQNRYIADLNRMLYFKNIANNRGLLTLLVDRAEDELFKEALLAYTFLLTTRPPSAMSKGSSDMLPAELGGISESNLERKIENWVLTKTGQNVEFESKEAVKLLSEFGLISFDTNENLQVLPLQAAIRNLPQEPKSIATKIEDLDIIEGYEKDVYVDTDEQYKKEEKKRKKYGWF